MSYVIFDSFVVFTFHTLKSFFERMEKNFKKEVSLSFASTDILILLMEQ